MLHPFKNVPGSKFVTLCGGMALTVLLVVVFFAWPYRNFLGFGQEPLIHVTELEKIATIVWLIGVVTFLVGYAIPDYSQWTETTEKRCKEELKEQVRKNKITEK